jgi:hypothetical protein
VCFGMEGDQGAQTLWEGLSPLVVGGWSTVGKMRTTALKEAFDGLVVKRFSVCCDHTVSNVIDSC